MIKEIFFKVVEFFKISYSVLLSNYYMTDITLGVREKVVEKKADIISGLRKLIIW